MTQATEERTVFGIRVEGDGERGYRSKVEQRPLEDLEPFLRPFIDAEVPIRWEQYTPYFNDGDVCEFHTWGIEVNVGNEEGDREDGWVESYDRVFRGGRHERWNRETGKYEAYGEEYPKHPLYDALQAFDEALGSRAYNSALYEAFGDHAQITVTGDVITVDYYEHD